MQRGSPPTVGLPGQRALPGGHGRCRGAPVVLSTVLRRARVRHRAACAAPLARKGRFATTSASPARAVPGGVVIMHRDLLFQQDITHTVRRAYAAIPTGAGKAAAQRLYSADELGPGGRAIGLDMLAEMCDRAELHAHQAGVDAWTEF